MKNNNELKEDDFLEYLIRAYYKSDTTYVQGFVNLNIISQAIAYMLTYFDNEDKLNSSNHTEIIKRVFQDNDITNQNCGTELGLSKKTFYRYKHKYLQIFKVYLLQNTTTDFLQAQEIG